MKKFSFFATVVAVLLSANLSAQVAAPSVSNAEIAATIADNQDFNLYPGQNPDLILPGQTLTYYIEPEGWMHWYVAPGETQWTIVRELLATSKFFALTEERNEQAEESQFLPTAPAVFTAELDEVSSIDPLSYAYDFRNNWWIERALWEKFVIVSTIAFGATVLTLLVYHFWGRKKDGGQGGDGSNAGEPSLGSPPTFGKDISMTSPDVVSLSQFADRILSANKGRVERFSFNMNESGGASFCVRFFPEEKPVRNGLGHPREVSARQPVM